MTCSAYYNENDAFAAQWLRNLIAAGHIAPGQVDQRDIQKVSADDLRGFTQCHFFAGLGAWSHALRLAGWADDRPVWTGSCPCQPFSLAGKQLGANDERHLWPVWFDLIRECRPATVFGEQVEGAVRHGWLDAVCADMEGEGYAIGAAVLGAHSVGAPHIRQRLWFVADAQCLRSQGRSLAGSREGLGIPGAQSAGASADGRMGESAEQRLQRGAEPWQRVDAQCSPPERDGPAGGMGNAQCNGLRNGRGATANLSDQSGNGSVCQNAGPIGRVADAAPGRQREHGRAPGAGGYAALGDADGGLAHARSGQFSQPQRSPEGRDGHGPTGPDIAGSAGRGGSHYGLWRDADWLLCRDGKWRPVEPGTLPLAHGAASRVGRLRAYGNAICAPLAAEFIASFLEARYAA